MKIKKGDKVKIILGKDNGREGLVERVLPKQETIVVTGLNLYKKTIRPKKEGDKGGIIDVARPLNIAKVMLICPKCHQPTRVGYQINSKSESAKQQKTRICRKCREVI